MNLQKECGATATSHQVVLLPQPFAQYFAISSRACIWLWLADISAMKTLFISSCHLCCCCWKKKKIKKRGSEGFYSPPFPETSAKWTRWLSPACISQHCSDLKSSIQPTVCHNCLILALFFLALLLSFSPHLFLPLSVQNPVMVEPNKQQGFFMCVHSQTLFPTCSLTSDLPL